MSQDTQRRQEALEVAFGLFLRFGYRKTSMDDLARAVGLSRQGLYLWFPNKKALFREVFDHHMNSKIASIEAALAQETRPLTDRVTDAFVAFTGVAVGERSEAMDELLEAGVSLLGDRIAVYEAAFQEKLTVALASCARDGATAGDLAMMLIATSTGWKYRAPDLDVYQRRMYQAVSLVSGGPST